VSPPVGVAAYRIATRGVATRRIASYRLATRRITARRIATRGRRHRRIAARRVAACRIPTRRSPPVLSPPVVSPPPLPPPPEPVAVPLLLGETKHGFTQVSADVVQSLHFVWNAESIVTDARSMTKVSFSGGDSVWIPPVARIEFQNGHIDFSGESQAAEVMRVYGTILGREPETSGLTYWVEHMQKGHTVAQVAESFFGSPEFIARFGGLSHQALVTSLYRQALGREPDAAGLAFYVGASMPGKPRADFADFV
jgi:hypothetical protein